jgi:hypothetical protein
MFALRAGMHQKEVRTMQWNRMNLDTRIVTVGESKTEARWLSGKRRTTIQQAQNGFYRRPATRFEERPTRFTTSHGNSVTGGICKSMKQFGSPPWTHFELLGLTCQHGCSYLCRPAHAA